MKKWIFITFLAISSTLCAQEGNLDTFSLFLKQNLPTNAKYPNSSPQALKKRNHLCHHIAKKKTKKNKHKEENFCHDWCEATDHRLCKTKKDAGILRVYGSFYTEVQDILIAPGQTIVLDQTSAISGGIILTPFGIFLQEPGDYFVKFGVAADESGAAQPINVALALNGILQPGSNITKQIGTGLGSVSTILHVTQPSTLTIFNSSPAIAFILGTLDVNNDVSAFLTIKKLHNLPTP